jgi:hypothetical protein
LVGRAWHAVPYMITTRQQSIKPEGGRQTHGLPTPVLEELGYLSHRAPPKVIDHWST